MAGLDFRLNSSEFRFLHLDCLFHSLHFDHKILEPSRVTQPSNLRFFSFFHHSQGLIQICNHAAAGIVKQNMSFFTRHQPTHNSKYPILKKEFSNAFSRFSFDGCAALVAITEVVAKLLLFVSSVLDAFFIASTFVVVDGFPLTMLPLLLLLLFPLDNALVILFTNLLSVAFPAVTVAVLRDLNFFFSNNCMRSISCKYSFWEATGK